MEPKREPIKWKCPTCKGEGSVSIPVLNDGKYSTKQKKCKRCKGTGYLVWINDTLKRIHGRERRTKGGIYLPN